MNNENQAINYSLQQGLSFINFISYEETGKEKHAI